MSEWVEPDVWYAQLPAFYAAAAVLATDPAGRVLLVKPNYRDHWVMPGGYVDAGEFPHDTVAREVNEELGLDLTPGRLLVVDWAPPAGPRPKPIINFVFDGGTIYDTRRIQLRTEELDDFGFFQPSEMTSRLPAAISPRVPAGLHARNSGETAYLFGGVARQTVHHHHEVA
jgi:8-oxo-dGTP diphosphatase